MRALGEDLILFRDKKGRVGLVHPRCCHRGASLFYGAVEDEGIRCCYHGWLFDREGHCLDQPAEPFHSEEHLATSDRAIVMLRRLFEAQVEAVEQGRDPA